MVSGQKMDQDVRIRLCHDIRLLQILYNDIMSLSIHLKTKNTDLALHYSDLEFVIVPVISDPVMDLRRSLRLFPFLLGILIIRAAGAGAGMLQNDFQDK